MAEEFQKAAQSLTDKKGGSGITKTDSLVDALEAIKTNAGSVDLGVLQSAKDALDGLAGALEGAAGGALAPAGGCFASCSGLYSSQVAAKLGKVKAESAKQCTMLSTAANEISELLASLAKTLDKVMPTVTKEVKELMKLPEELTKIGEALQKGPNEIAHIDMGPITKCLDVEPINQPLDELVMIQQDSGEDVKRVSAAVAGLARFLKAAPGQVRHAFDIGCLPIGAAAPSAMIELLGKLESLAALDLQPLVEALSEMEKHLCSFHPEAVRGPVKEYASHAKEQVDPLMKLVEDAKNAAGVFGQVQGLMKGIFK